MKKRFVVVLTAIALLACFLIPALAEGTTNARLNYITDMANLLSDTEIAALEEKAADISERNNYGVYVIIVNDFRSYSDYSQLDEAGKDIYTRYQLGWDTDNGGTMLILSMADRDYHVGFNAVRSNYLFLERDRNNLEDKVVRYLRNNDYYEAFNAYLDGCDACMTGAANREYNEDWEEDDGGISVGIAAIPGALAALLTGLGMSAPMRSAVKKTNANSYVVDGSLELTRRSDMFLHRSVTRTPRQTQSSSPSSRSTRYSSGSYSGRSGKF